MVEEYSMYINGEWIKGVELIDSVNPFNQQVWAQIPQATQSQVEYAIDSARDTFEGRWAQTNGKTRAELMHRLADLLDQDAQRMAELETTDNGKVIRETKNQMHFSARNYRYFAGFADKLYGEVIPLDNPDLFDFTTREPLGVAVLITSWNSPMSLLSNKLAPALAAGCTVIVKPSEHTSVTTIEFAKLMDQAGFPPGVFNVVTGDSIVGDYLTKSKKVNKISFTGGSGTGRIISKNASENFIPVTLELGGKSPNIIFDDANLERAVVGAIAGIFAASGQTCIAGSRLLVQKNIYDEVITKMIDRANSIKLGNPLDLQTEMGPAANEPQYNKILSMIQKGKEEGAELVCGGTPMREGDLQHGYFIAPTIFSNVNNKTMTIAREEIFGPVLSVIPFEDEDDALEIANDTEYGLSSGVWTQDINRANRMAKKLQAGTVWVNTYRNAAAGAPFGGIKNSGYGRERSHHAILDYTYIKNVMIDTSDSERDPFSLQTK